MTLFAFAAPFRIQLGKRILDSTIKGEDNNKYEEPRTHDSRHHPTLPKLQRNVPPPSAFRNFNLVHAPKKDASPWFHRTDLSYCDRFHAASYAPYKGRLGLIEHGPTVSTPRHEVAFPDSAAL